MDKRKFVDHYMDQHQEAVHEEYQDLRDQVAQSKAVYKGQPVPFLYSPKLYTPQDLENFQKAMKDIFSLVNKTIGLYLEEEKVQAFYDFSPKLHELICQDHGYEINVPMGRFDIFYHEDGSYEFCELNADGASAMLEEAELSAILQASKGVAALKDQYEVTSFELFASWVKTVKELYYEYSGKDLKHLAIVDFIDKSSPLEFTAFQKAFEEAGVNATIIDPREIEYRDGHMYAKGHLIEAVYRRLVTRDMMEGYEEIPAFIEGLKAGNTCVIGPIKSQIIHSKKFFALLHDPEMAHYFTSEEQDYIKAHIPYTLLWKGQDLEQAIKRRSKLLLKPIDYYASKGVYAGKEYSEGDWIDLLNKTANTGYLLQEFCQPAPMEHFYLDGDQMKKDTFNHITGLYVYGEKFAGVYTRAGLNPIISGIHGGFTMSTLLVK